MLRLRVLAHSYMPQHKQVLCVWGRFPMTKTRVHIGFWKDGKEHGYGKLITHKGEVKEGLFEHGEFVEKRSDIKTYDPYHDPIAKKINFQQLMGAANNDLVDPVARKETWDGPIRDKPAGTEIHPILEGLDNRTGHAQGFFEMAHEWRKAKRTRYSAATDGPPIGRYAYARYKFLIAPVLIEEHNPI